MQNSCITVLRVKKTAFLTRSMQDEALHPAWEGCGNDFSALTL